MEETRNQKYDRKSNKGIVAIFLLLTVVVMIAVGIGWYQKKSEAIRRSQEYLENLTLATYTMLSGAADAENCCNLIQQVWSNAIWQEEDSATDRYTKPDGFFVTDFNNALVNLFKDPEFCSQVNDIMENRETVDAIIKRLKNPPEEYRAAYEALSECYGVYLSLTKMAIDPSGSLQTFTDDFNNFDTEFLRCYQLMDFYL